MAIVHLAMFEAVNTIVHRYESYKPSGSAADIRSMILSDIAATDGSVTSDKTSVPEAIARAAYDTLAYLYPQKLVIIDADLTETSVLIEGGKASAPKVLLGRSIGEAAARHVIALRQNDGSEAQGENSSCPTVPPIHRTCLEPRFPAFTDDWPGRLIGSLIRSRSNSCG